MRAARGRTQGSLILRQVETRDVMILGLFNSIQSPLWRSVGTGNYMELLNELPPLMHILGPWLDSRMYQRHSKAFELEIFNRGTNPHSQGMSRDMLTCSFRSQEFDHLTTTLSTHVASSTPFDLAAA